MINGQEYSFEDVQVYVFEEPLNGIEGIEYIAELDHYNIYGRGSKAVAVGRGQERFSGTLWLLQNEAEKLQEKLSFGQNLTHLQPFDITISYAPDNGIIKTDVLKYCRISRYAKRLRNGEGFMLVELPLVIGQINYNI